LSREHTDDVQSVEACEDHPVPDDAEHRRGPFVMAEERRIVTVFFADVVGSTAIGESLDPEDLRHLMGSFFSVAREVIEEYGGTLEKFIGDAVMAIFGVPRAHDDDARRALSAALDLRARLRADPRLRDRLPIRIGINTGEVVSGVGGSADQTLATGDAVNVAARLQQQAKPWAILCGERTVVAAGGGFSFGPSRRLEARGRSTVVLGRELVGTRVPDTSSTPFVGREPDMTQLELLARRAFSERRPWLLTIVAPPGTGKSRLLSEFLAGLRAISPDATIAVSYCLPYGQRLTYWPLRTVLHQLVGLADEVPEGELIGAVRAWLLEREVPDPGRTAELLGATIGMAAAEPAVASELFAAWRTFLEAAAKRRPLVLAFEDLHWSSDSLLELLDYAMQPRSDVPALLVAVARPELLDRRPGWGAGRRNHVTLDLAPLSSASVSTIVEHLLSSSAPELVESIVTRAEGNPFFAGEIARSVVERAAAVGGGSGGRSGEAARGKRGGKHGGRAGDAAGDRAGGQADDAAERLRIARDLPDTIQATIQARIDLLEPPERRVLQIGAVFGRSFEVAGVAAVSGAAVGDVGQSVDRLVDRDLLTIVDRGEVAARHILIRDVAYNALPRMDRANAHASVARWLASRAAPEDGQPIELIAFHLREAATLLATIDVPPAELPLVRDEAVIWLRRAADRALGAAASADAVGHLQAAIELAGSTDLPDLYERLGDANLQGELTADAYRRAQDLATGTDVPANTRLRILGKLLMQVARSQGAVSKRPSGEDMAALRAAGQALLAEADDDRAIARFLIAEAFLPFWATPSDPAPDRATAKAEGSRGLAIAVRLDDPDLRSAALDALTALSDTWPEALDRALERLEFQERLQLVERVDAHSMVAWCASTVGRLADADRVSAQGLALVQEGQVPTYALHLATWRLYALRLLGRWDDLDRVADEALELWEATGRSAAAFAVRGFIAALEVARARRRPERAARFETVVRDILDQFPVTRPIRRTVAFLEPDLDALAAIVEDSESVLAEEHVLGRIDYVERALSRCLDEGRTFAPERLREIGRGAAEHGCRMLEAEVRRGLGLGGEDGPVESRVVGFRADELPGGELRAGELRAGELRAGELRAGELRAGELRAALATFEAADARPLIARVRVELGRLTGDAGLIETGLDALRSLGDLEHLARVDAALSADSA
jgi:class 3 adenylate cyclase